SVAAHEPTSRTPWYQSRRSEVFIAYHRVCATFAAARDREREGGARPVGRLDPQTAVVPFNLGAADREPDSHAIALRGVKRVEQLVHGLTIEANSGIPDRQAHRVRALALGSNQQSSGAIVHVDHRVDGIAD